MEKPVAVDAAGVRKVLEVAAEAKKKNLKVGVGLQRRHKPGYLENRQARPGWRPSAISCTPRTFWDMGTAPRHGPAQARVERARVPAPQPILLRLAVRRYHRRYGPPQHRHHQLDQGRLPHHRQGRGRRGSAQRPGRRRHLRSLRRRVRVPGWHPPLHPKPPDPRLLE